MIRFLNNKKEQDKNFAQGSNLLVHASSINWFQVIEW